MRFWTTDVISDDNKIYRLFEESVNPLVGHLKDYIIATIFYHNHDGKDDVTYKVIFEDMYVDNPREMYREFSTLKEAKEYVNDVLDLNPEEVVNYDFDEDFVKPFVSRGYFKPHDFGM